jgi:hypothetical protein
MTKHADYAPHANEREWAELAFAGPETGAEMSDSENHGATRKAHDNAGPMLG